MGGREVPPAIRGLGQNCVTGPKVVIQQIKYKHYILLGFAATFVEHLYHVSADA